MPEYNAYINMPTPPTPVCDFCSAPDVQWSYPARDFIVREEGLVVGIGESELTAKEFILDQGSHGGWAACPACSALVERGDRERLARRSAKRLIRTHPELGLSLRQVLPDVRRRHDDFWANREGPRVSAVGAKKDPTQP